MKLLQGGGAHATLDKALDELPAELSGAKAPGLPHTVWQLVEHLRIAQWDILEFSRDKDHVSPDFPEGLLVRTPTPRRTPPPGTRASRPSTRI